MQGLLPPGRIFARHYSSRLSLLRGWRRQAAVALPDNVDRICLCHGGGGDRPQYMLCLCLCVCLCHGGGGECGDGPAGLPNIAVRLSLCHGGCSDRPWLCPMLRLCLCVCICHGGGGDRRMGLRTTVWFTSVFATGLAETGARGPARHHGSPLSLSRGWRRQIAVALPDIASVFATGVAESRGQPSKQYEPKKDSAGK